MLEIRVQFHLNSLLTIKVRVFGPYTLKILHVSNFDIILDHNAAATVLQGKAAPSSQTGQGSSKQQQASKEIFE
jgi:hypothetical protein